MDPINLDSSIADRSIRSVADTTRSNSSITNHTQEMRMVDRNDNVNQIAGYALGVVRFYLWIMIVVAYLTAIFMIPVGALLLFSTSMFAGGFYLVIGLVAWFAAVRLQRFKNQKAGSSRSAKTRSFAPRSLDEAPYQRGDLVMAMRPDTGQRQVARYVDRALGGHRVDFSNGAIVTVEVVRPVSAIDL